MSNHRTVHAACPHDCPDTCAMLVEVTDGRATSVTGDDAHPTTRGFLCTKVTRYLERVYHPDRLLYPMRRNGAKGEGRFTRISWDEAISEMSLQAGAIARWDNEGGASEASERQNISIGEALNIGQRIGETSPQSKS